MQLNADDVVFSVQAKTKHEPPAKPFGTNRTNVPLAPKFLSSS